jgi:hypothetical protein
MVASGVTIPVMTIRGSNVRSHRRYSGEPVFKKYIVADLFCLVEFLLGVALPLFGFTLWLISLRSKQAKKFAKNTSSRIQSHDPSSSNWPLADIDARECAQLRIFWNNGSSFSESGVLRRVHVFACFQNFIAPLLHVVQLVREQLKSLLIRIG